MPITPEMLQKYLSLSKEDRDTLMSNAVSKNIATSGGALLRTYNKFEDGGPEKTYQDYVNSYNNAVVARKQAMADEEEADSAYWNYYDSLPSSVKHSASWAYWKDPKAKKLADKNHEAADRRAKSTQEFRDAQYDLGLATIDKYRGTAHDLLKYGRWADSEEGSIKYLADNGVRESAGADEVADYFNSYASSPGIERIIENQAKWGHDRYPYKRIYDFTNYGKAGYTRSARALQNLLKEHPMTSNGVFDMDGYSSMSFNYTNPYTHFIMNSGASPFYEDDAKGFGYYGTLAHEMMHDYNLTGGGQGDALYQNTNTAPGHDSRLNERHSDLEALRFLLYKEGIYDSRGDKDATAEDIKKLREKHPEFRPLIQMDNEKAAWMINHVADNNSGIDMSNIAAYGGTLLRPYNRFEGVGNLYWPGGSLSPVNRKVFTHGMGNAVRRLIPKRIVESVNEAASSHSDEKYAAKDFFDTTVTKEGREYLKDITDSDFKDVGRGFLLDDSRQRQFMESLGYHLVDDMNYGMVNKATNNLMQKTGKPRVPIYQLGEDDIDPSLVTLVSTDPKVVSHYHVPYDRQLNHANSYPSALYVDADGNHYVKSWDLNDYGQHNGNLGDSFVNWVSGYSGSNKDSSGSTYGKNQFLAEMYDLVGNPFVQRTGLVKVDEPDVVDEKREERLKAALDALSDLTTDKPDYRLGGVLLHPYNEFRDGGWAEKYNKLSSEFKNAVNSVAQKVGIAKNKVSDWYESADGRRILAGYYKGLPDDGRVRRNTSKTQDASEAITYGMHQSIIKGNSGSIPTRAYEPSGYDVPYIIEKEERIPGIGRVPMNAVDSLAKYAGQAGISMQEALGLFSQETNGGAIPYNNYKSTRGLKGEALEEAQAYNTALAGSNYFREYGLIPANYLVRDFEYDRKGHAQDRSVPPLLHAFKYFKAGKYNPGDPNHTRDVLSKGAEALESKTMQDYLRNSEYAKGVPLYKNKK